MGEGAEGTDSWMLLQMAYSLGGKYVVTHWCSTSLWDEFSMLWRILHAFKALSGKLVFVNCVWIVCGEATGTQMPWSAARIQSRLVGGGCFCMQHLCICPSRACGIVLVNINCLGTSNVSWDVLKNWRNVIWDGPTLQQSNLALLLSLYGLIMSICKWLT